MVDVRTLEDIEEQAVREGASTPEQFLSRVLELVAVRKQGEKLTHAFARRRARAGSTGIPAIPGSAPPHTGSAVRAVTA